MFMRTMTFALTACLSCVALAGDGSDAPARAASSDVHAAALTSVVAPRNAQAVRSALEDPEVKAQLARHVRKLRLDPDLLVARAPTEYDLKGVNSDATLPAPTEITAAEIQALKGSKPARAVTNLKVITPDSTAYTPPAPQGPRPQIAPRPTPTLDVSNFGQQLHAALSPNVTGYMMRLRKDGKTIYTLQWNWAQTTADKGLGWNPDRRMHVASVSKLITAIAMTRALDEASISWDAPIAVYLPGYWTRGANVEKITFRHLMRHTSGISTGGSGGSFRFAKQQIAADIPAADIGKKRDYENVNYSLLRILIATVAGYIDRDATFKAGFGTDVNDLMWDLVTNLAYVDYVYKNVFAPAGVNGPTLDKPADAALAYAFGTNGPGWNSGNLSSMSGGAGWHMSVDEVLNVMGAFRRGKILPMARANEMLNAGFGVDSPVNGVRTPAGRLYHKNGRWRSGARQEQCAAFFLPDNMELVVFVNSGIGANDTFLRVLVQQLYVNNIVMP